MFSCIMYFSRDRVMGEAEAGCEDNKVMGIDSRDGWSQEIRNVIFREVFH